MAHGFGVYPPFILEVRDPTVELELIEGNRRKICPYKSQNFLKGKLNATETQLTVCESGFIIKSIRPFEMYKPCTKFKVNKPCYWLKKGKQTLLLANKK